MCLSDIFAGHNQVYFYEPESGAVIGGATHKLADRDGGVDSGTSRSPCSHRVGLYASCGPLHGCTSVGRTKALHSAEEKRILRCTVKRDCARHERRRRNRRGRGRSHRHLQYKKAGSHSPGSGGGPGVWSFWGACLPMFGVSCHFRSSGRPA